MNNASARVGIVGVSGYAGTELARILAGHPRMSVAAAVSDRWAGSTLGDHLPLSGEVAGLRVLSQEEAPRLTGLDLVFLCTPAEVSLELAPRALDGGSRVVDLSGA